MIAAILCTTWGLMFIVQRLALEESPPLWVAAGRASVAAVVLLPLGGPSAHAEPARRAASSSCSAC